MCHHYCVCVCDFFFLVSRSPADNTMFVSFWASTLCASYLMQCVLTSNLAKHFLGTLTAMTIHADMFSSLVLLQ